MYQQVILNKIYEYVKKFGHAHQKSGKMLMLECPFCDGVMSANKLPNNYKVYCHHCKATYDLLAIVREIDRKGTDEELFQYLKNYLGVEVTTKKDEEDLDGILSFFEEQGFDLVPVANNAKNPIEQGWTQKEHKNKDEWAQWILNSLNVGVKTGHRSNVTVIDIDQKEIPEKLKEALYKVPTLIQETRKGWHFFFKFEEDLPKTRIDEYKLDLENEGGQVVVHPSIVEGVGRKFQGLVPVAQMPEELKALLRSKVTVPRRTNSELLKEEIESENFQLDMFEEGGRNSSLIKLGGVFRKQLNSKQTEFVLHVLNNHNSNPLPYKEIGAMGRKLEHYIEYDEQELAHEIIDYLKNTEYASKAEIEIACLDKRATGENKKRIDRTLVYLIKEGKIAKKGERQYKLIKRMEWTDSLIDIAKPVPFEVPYVGDYAYFNWGDFIVLGSQNKYGKTTLAQNIIKRFVQQGIKPYYIYSESGGRFKKTALRLGLKDGDFYSLFCGNANEIEIEPNSVTIFDWVRPVDGFNKTDSLYDGIVQKLQKTNAFMMCFVQLKKDNGWFAENMITQYPAMAMKYLYEDESDGTHTKFQITDVRDPKIRGKKFEIPCVYNFETKEVERVERNNGE